MSTEGTRPRGKGELDADSHLVVGIILDELIEKVINPRRLSLRNKRKATTQCDELQQQVNRRASDI